METYISVAKKAIIVVALAVAIVAVVMWVVLHWPSAVVLIFMIAAGFVSGVYRPAEVGAETRLLLVYGLTALIMAWILAALFLTHGWYSLVLAIIFTISHLGVEVLKQPAHLGASQ